MVLHSDWRVADTPGKNRALPGPSGWPGSAHGQMPIPLYPVVTLGNGRLRLTDSVKSGWHGIASTVILKIFLQPGAHLVAERIVSRMAVANLTKQGRYGNL